MIDQFFSNSQFGLWRKWFWIGIVAAFSNVIVGLVYGIALAVEKDRRNEGLIIIAVAIAWFCLTFFFLSGWLVEAGLLPKYQLLKVQ